MPDPESRRQTSLIIEGLELRVDGGEVVKHVVDVAPLRIPPDLGTLEHLNQPDQRHWPGFVGGDTAKSDLSRILDSDASLARAHEVLRQVRVEAIAQLKLGPADEVVVS